MNKKLKLKELLNYAEEYKFLVLTSYFLAVISSVMFILSFWYVWKIVGHIVFSEESENIVYYGKLALIFAVISILFYFFSLFCSHKAALRVASNIRIKLFNHVSSIPFENLDSFGIGTLRRTIIDTTSTIEKYLAHQLPDKYAALCSSTGFTCLLFYVDWKLALVSLAPIMLGFIVMAFMTGDAVRAKLAEYKNALNVMSSEAAEYVRTMPLMKTFGQSLVSLTRFQKSVENYEARTIAYTQELRPAIMCFTLAMNGAFAFLIGVGVFIAFYFGVSREFLNNFILAVTMTPLISFNLARTIRQNENEKRSADAMRKINEILNLKIQSISAKI